MKITEITGTMTDSDGTVTHFTIGADAGWQQWGERTEVLGTRVDVLEAMASAAADTGDLASNADDDDDDAQEDSADSDTDDDLAEWARWK